MRRSEPRRERWLTARSRSVRNRSNSTRGAPLNAATAGPARSRAHFLKLNATGYPPSRAPGHGLSASTLQREGTRSVQLLRRPQDVSSQTLTVPHPHEIVREFGCCTTAFSQSEVQRIGKTGTSSRAPAGQPSARRLPERGRANGRSETDTGKHRRTMHRARNDPLPARRRTRVVALLGYCATTCTPAAGGRHGRRFRQRSSTPL
jgi:hypothetical protein